MIQQNLDLPWSWQGLSKNPNITMDFIIQHIDKPWDWKEISNNEFLSTLSWKNTNSIRLLF